MLDAPLATVIAAAIALAGTLIGIIVGYRRWSRERTSERFRRFETDRQDIYKSLWDRVEEINAALRRDRVDDSGYRERLADLNEFIIRNGAHVDDADYQLVNEYVAAVKHFDDAVSVLEPEAQVPYGDTRVIPREVLQRARDVADAQEHVLQLRNQLRSKVRTVIGGPNTQ
jgi:hypothetical protein